MADEILAPPASNVVSNITPDVIQPTPEEIAAYEKVAGPPPAPAFNPIAELSAEELANLAVKDKSFDIASAFQASADLHGDPAIVQKSADALNLIKQRGFKLADLPSLPEAGKAVLHTAEGFGKQLWNYANAAGNIVQSAVADAVGATEFSEASRVEANRRLAGNIAGTEEAVTGLTQLAEKGIGKAGRALGITKSHAEKTPEERVADLFADVGKAEVQQQRLAGRGPFSQAVTAGTSAKADLNPEDVATLAAGDPFSFYLFGAAGKLAHAAVPLVARTAITAGTEAATQAAGRVAQVVGGKVIQGAGKVVGGTAGLVEKTAPVVAPIAGAVKGGALYGPAGIAGGFIAGERAGKILASGARRVGGVADNLADIGKQIASSAPVKSAYAQAGRDFLQALPGATYEAAKGAALDLGLAAASAETPAETAGAAAFGTVLGALGGAARIGGRVISGQLIAPREYGISTPQPSSGHFPAFDTVHNEAFKSASPGIKARLNALRKFTSGAAETDVFYAPDAARLAEALQSSGLSQEQAAAFSQHQGFFSANMPDATGTPRKVIIVTNPDAAPHESFHAIQDVLGEQGNQAVDAIVREAYADQWDKQGTDYANRLGGEGETWRHIILDATGKGMAEAKEKIFQDIYNGIERAMGAPSRALVESLAKEAYGQLMDKAVAKNPRLDPNEIGAKVWREIFKDSPEEITRIADTYIARELAAENFDAIFKHAGPSLAEPNSLPAKLARVAGRVMSALGMDTTGGRVAELGKTTLRAPVIEAVRKVGQGRLPEVTISPRGEKAPIGKVGTPTEEARAIAAEAPETPTERGTMSQREMLGNVAESIAAREGVKINYLSAPGEPAAATTSNRQARRDIIEAFRDMPAAARSLWEKTFFPERVRKTQGGKYQVFGWAPEVFAANAHKMASFLTSHPELSPYAIDAAMKSFTPEAWQELYRDTQTFVQNQKAGQTGSGEPLVVPKSMTDRGFTAPASRAADAVALDQNKADFINLLFNAKLPETPRIQKGKTPLNLAGQEVSAATIAGRVEVPVRPRGEYTGAEAERQGIAGREIAEVNPLRNQIEAAALADKKPMPSLIEANQMLNLENIKELERAPEQPEFRANTLTLQAGFAPAMEKALRDLPPVLKGAVRLYHGEGGPQGGGTGGAFFTTTPEKAATYGPRISYVDVPAESAKVARETARKIGQGGDTSVLQPVDVARAKSIGREVEPITYDLDASFAPKDAMEKLKNLPDAEWQEEMTNFKGRYGSNLTGWAYEIGSQVKTADDLQAFRSTSEAINIATTAAMKAGDYAKAMNLSVRSQAAHEAYQAATGETFDGKSSGAAKFIRERYDPEFKYPMPPAEVKSAAFSPALRKAEREHDRAVDAYNAFVRDNNYIQGRTYNEIGDALIVKMNNTERTLLEARNSAAPAVYSALAEAERAHARAGDVFGGFLRNNTSREINASKKLAAEYRELSNEAVRSFQRVETLRIAARTPATALPSWTVETVGEGKPITGQRNIRVVDENGETVEIRSGFRGTDAEALTDAAFNRRDREAYQNSPPGTTPQAERLRIADEIVIENIRNAMRTPVVSPALEAKTPSEEKMELRSGQKLLFPEKRLPVWPRVVELWKNLGKDEELAKYGTSESADPNTIARELSIPEERIRAEETSGNEDVEYKSLDFGRERDGNIIDDPDFVKERANEILDDVRAKLIKKDLKDRLVELRRYHDTKGNLVHEEKLDADASKEARSQADRDFGEDPPREWTSDIGDYVIRYDGNGGEYHVTSGLGRNPRNASFSTFDEARDRAGENALDRGLLDPESRGSETGDISFSNDKGSITITDSEGDLHIDAMNSRKKGGGAGLYKAAFTWAHNNGITIGVGSLTAVNSKRRTSNMLSFALQTGDTSFTKPGYAQKVPWTTGAHELNIENLLRAEMKYVFDEAPKLKNLRFDTKSGMFADEAGKKYDAVSIDDKLKAILEPYRAAAGSDFATGVATAKRAILTSSFLRTLDASSVASELSALKAGGKAGGTSGLLGEVLYAPKSGSPIVEGRNLPAILAPPSQEERTPAEVEPRNL